MKTQVVLILSTCVLLAFASCSVARDPLAPLDSTARLSIRAVPVPWRVIKSTRVAAEQTAAIANKLGGRIDSLSNATLEAFGDRVQVNTLACPTQADAKTLAQALRKIRQGAEDLIILDDTRAIELVGPSLDLCRRASYELGLRPTPKTMHWKVEFDVAPVSECRDPMAWNPLFNAFLKHHSGDASAAVQIAEHSRSFEFGRKLSIGWEGADLTLTPAVESKVVGKSGRVDYRMGELPQVAGVPTVHVNGIVTIPPESRPATAPDASLTAPTLYWPADDPELVALAKQITDGRTDPREQVNALLAWLAPGAHIHYGGPVGSRLGVKTCLTGKQGRCWDFSDLFISLCRARGIPARQTIGWLYGAEGHVWAEVYLPRTGWTPVDATGGGQVTCGPFHIPWATSDDGHLTFVYTSRPVLVLP